MIEVRRALARHRPGLLEAEAPQGRAAVALILRDHEAEPELLLIRRAEREGDPWSGHMALPGGRREPADPDDLTTAIRETFEEIGLDLLEHGRLLGRLDDVPAVARGRRIPLTIAVFAFELTATPALAFSPEVVEALWVPVAALAGGELDATFAYDHEGQRYELPAWNVEGRVVWGLTYRMLRGLLALGLSPPA